MTVDPTVRLGRLRDSREIVAVLRGGQRRAGRHLVLHTAPGVGDPAMSDTPPPVGAAHDVTDGNPTGDVGAEVHDDAEIVTRDGSVRIAVVASRKVGSAVARNRAKRVLREAARRVAWKPGTDAVLVARRTCATTHMSVVLAELRDLAGDLDVGRSAA